MKTEIKSKLKVTAIIILWLITLAIPFILCNVPRENQNGGLVSEYEVEYKGDTYRCIDTYPDFSEFESKDKIWSGVIKDFWLVKNENGEEFIYVSQYGEDFLCEKITDNSSSTTSIIIAITIISAVFSALATAFMFLPVFRKR